MMPEHRDIPVADIQVDERKRKIGDVTSLAASIQDQGLLQRIAVRRMEDGSFLLIYGLRRMEAAKLLGWKAIPADVFSIDEIDHALKEIDENLERQELTALERFEHQNQKKELYEARYPQTVKGVAQGEGMKRSATLSDASVTEVPTFREVEAKRTGQEPATVNRHIMAAKQITPEVKAYIRETKPDLGAAHLTEIARFIPGAQMEAARSACEEGVAWKVLEERRKKGGHTARPSPCKRKKQKDQPETTGADPGPMPETAAPRADGLSRYVEERDGQPRMFGDKPFACWTDIGSTFDRSDRKQHITLSRDTIRAGHELAAYYGYLDSKGVFRHWVEKFPRSLRRIFHAILEEIGI